MATEREQKARRRFSEMVWERCFRHPGARQAWERGQAIGAVLLERTAKRKAGQQAGQAAKQRQRAQAPKAPALSAIERKYHEALGHSEEDIKRYGLRAREVR